MNRPDQLDVSGPDSDVTPALSVIIVNWNVRDMLRDSLLSLYGQAQATSSPMEVIVVDNASEDGSVDMLRAEFPQVRLIVNSRNTGFGQANNLGLTYCRARYVCLLNPDTVVLDGAIDRCMKFLQDNPKVAMVGPRLINTDGSLQRWTAGAFPTLCNIAVHHLLLTHVLPRSLQCPSLFLRDDTQLTTDVEWVSGACMLLRREALKDQLFDDRFFMYGEDMELCHRLHSAGWRIVYLPSATIYHHHGGSMKRQTSTDVQAASLRGPRTFYAQIQPNPLAQRCVDVLIAIGFLVRWGLYAAAATVSSQPRYRTQSKASRRYFGIAVSLLFGTAT